jgi:hypothetical protein
VKAKDLENYIERLWVAMGITVFYNS